MKFFLSLSLLSSLTLAFAAPVSSTEYTFGKVIAKPGEKIHMVSHMESAETSVEKQLNGLLSSGSITSSRDIDLTWTFRQPDENGTRRAMVKIQNFSQSTTASFAGKNQTDTSPSPLCDKLLEVSKPTNREWKFSLDNSLPYYRVEHELDVLTLYLKRSWYPDYPVKLGDSWEFDPILIQALITKDFKNAKTLGTMRLRQIKHTETATYATIDITINASGANFSSDGTAKDSAIQLSGSMTLNLSTMLEESIEIKGSIHSKISTGIDQFDTKLPVTLKVTKAFVR